MLILLSPAKTLDFASPSETNICTEPEFLEFSKNLVKGLSRLTSVEVAELMHISPKLADLNRQRFLDWQIKHTTKNSKQAILAFKGDVYAGLEAWKFKKEDFKFAQKKLRMLSGLYGLLKPLDLIQPYRLEMGTIYENPLGKDLYSFWGDKLSQTINRDLKEEASNLVVNLASQEYFKAAQASKIKGEIISPSFLDEKNGKYKIISFYAKKARGYMANYLVTNRINSIKELSNFSAHGYQYSKGESTPTTPVFTRSEKQREVA